jgi:hypothetical protein
VSTNRRRPPPCLRPSRISKTTRTCNLVRFQVCSPPLATAATTGATKKSTKASSPIMASDEQRARARPRNTTAPQLLSSQSTYAAPSPSLYRGSTYCSQHSRPLRPATVLGALGPRPPSASLASRRVGSPAAAGLRGAHRRVCGGRCCTRRSARRFPPAFSLVQQEQRHPTRRGFGSGSLLRQPPCPSEIRG